MHVAVGSRNPVKRDAVAQALSGEGPPDDTELTTVGVDSGVAEQPRGHAETVRGARTRARRALEAVDGATLGVGLEGGIAGFDGSDGTYLVMWAAATDGDGTGEGGGPSYRLPDTVAARVDAGDELGPVMDDFLGRTAVGENEGAAGAFTGGRVTRAEALEAAVAGALGPFVTDHYE
jgi:inosine/xanthosine triphosphatase